MHERKEVGEEKKKRERKGREGEGCNGGGSLHAREIFHRTSKKEREIEKGRKKRESDGRGGKDGISSSPLSKRALEREKWGERSG